MAEKATLARPYAKAAFIYAKEHQQMQLWSTFLASLAMLSKDARVTAYLTNPLHNREHLVQFLSKMSDVDGQPMLQNFLWLLVSNKRLGIIAEIASQFDELRQESEKILDVEVLTFAPELSQKQYAELTRVLRAKLDRNVSITVRQDKSLLGGMIIRAGHLVFNASTREKLEKLKHVLQS